jgi:hypothetical protein
MEIIVILAFVVLIVLGVGACFFFYQLGLSNGEERVGEEGIREIIKSRLSNKITENPCTHCKGKVEAVIRPTGKNMGVEYECRKCHCIWRSRAILRERHLKCYSKKK